jgi:hypothetical protein
LKIKPAYYLLIILPFVNLTCGQKKEAKTKTKSLNSNQSEQLKVVKEEIYPISYHLNPMNDSLAKALKVELTDTQFKLILTINRVDLRHLPRQDSIIIPDSFFVNYLKYSPFPSEIKTITNIHKIIYFSYRLQAFAVYENGILIRWGPTSMGRKTKPTPTGLFHTNWKSKRAISTFDDEWIMKWYFNLENFEGVSMHQYDLPGYPASHACLRLSEQDSKWFYTWCEPWILGQSGEISAYGTPVIIFGTYPFGERKPWRAVDKNLKDNFISSKEVEHETEPYLEIIKKRQATRDSIQMPQSL